MKSENEVLLEQDLMAKEIQKELVNAFYIGMATAIVLILAVIGLARLLTMHIPAQG